MTAIDDLSEGLDKRVALTMHERGRELTPDQVREISRGAISKTRNHMREKGYDMPDSDREMLGQIQKALEYGRSCTAEEDVDISEADFAGIMAMVNAGIARTSPKKWCVIGPDGETIQRYETEQAARRSCYERNLRARNWDLSAMYSVLFLDS